MKRFLWLAATLVTVAPAVAQSPTADQLRRAQAMYDQLELELAARLVRSVLSPQWASPVQPAERVEALKLLGATLVLTGHADSAVTQFSNALRLDPFTDLEAEEFTPAQVGAFARARRRVFAVATRPLAEARVDPRVERIRFPLATTHDASVRAELRRSDSVVAVFESASEGSAEIVWNGLTNRGRLAPPGRYELRVHASSRLLTASDSASTYFDLRAEIAPLEDSLPALGPTDLLPERSPASTGFGELGKGIAVAGGVLVIAGPLTNAALGESSSAQPVVVASVGILAGVLAFLQARKQRDIPANVALNRTRLDERRAANEAIAARNAGRISATILLIAPAAGVEP